MIIRVYRVLTVFAVFVSLLCGSGVASATLGQAQDIGSFDDEV